jgi:STAS domain
MSARGPTIVCDVTELGPPDLGTVAALARLALEGRRVGLELRIARAPCELRELIAFAGLDAVLLAVEVGGQPEQREQPRGVEEERQFADGAA